MKPYVVNTRYLSIGGMLVVHSYGPYTQSVARRERSRLLKQASAQGLAERVAVHVCELIDAQGDSPFTVEYRR